MEGLERFRARSSRVLDLSRARSGVWLPLPRLPALLLVRVASARGRRVLAPRECVSRSRLLALMEWRNGGGIPRAQERPRLSPPDGIPDVVRSAPVRRHRSVPGHEEGGLPGRVAPRPSGKPLEPAGIGRHPPPPPTRT